MRGGKTSERAEMMKHDFLKNPIITIIVTEKGLSKIDVLLLLNTFLLDRYFLKEMCSSYLQQYR